MKKLSLILVLALAGCVTPDPVIIEKTVEVKVPVTVPCVTERPSEPTALRDRFSRAEWEALTTDQRENILGAQHADRKIYGDRLTVATAGCDTLPGAGVSR